MFKRKHETVIDSNHSKSGHRIASPHQLIAQLIFCDIFSWLHQQIYPSHLLVIMSHTIHPFSSVYLGLDHVGSSLSREVQTFLSPSTSSSLSMGTPLTLIWNSGGGFVGGTPKRIVTQWSQSKSRGIKHIFLAISEKYQWLFVYDSNSLIKNTFCAFCINIQFHLIIESWMNCWRQIFKPV